MKLVIAIIQPHKLEAVKRELEAVEVNLMTVTNVVGQGRQKGVTEIYPAAPRKREACSIKSVWTSPSTKPLWNRRLPPSPKARTPVPWAE